jgi:hypothetical protein
MDMKIALRSTLVLMWKANPRVSKSQPTSGCVIDDVRL